jgi:phosphoglycolate phosphatase
MSPRRDPAVWTRAAESFRSLPRDDRCRAASPATMPVAVSERAHDVVVLFDVDGTLVTTGGAGARSWRWAFDHLYGVPADIAEVSEAGMTDPVVARRTFRAALHREPTQGELSQLADAYLERLTKEVATSAGYAVLPGAEGTLRRLCARGYYLGIVTGAMEAAARVKLARGGLNHFFSFGGYGSDSEDRIKLTAKAIARATQILGGEVDLAGVYVVGDTPRDIDAARGVGAVPIGVASGGYSARELRLAGAHAVLSSLRHPIPGLD